VKEPVWLLNEVCFHDPVVVVRQLVGAGVMALVVALMLADWPELFPAASKAATA